MPESEKDKKTKKELEESLEDLQSYIEELTAFLPVSVCIFSPIGVIIDVNKAFQNLTDFKQFEIIGKAFEELFTEKTQVKNILKDAIKKEVVKEEELTLISKEKKRVPVSLFVSTRKDVEGNFIGYFSALLDITEIKKYREELERRVEERTKELQEKVEELEKFQKISIGREIKMVELKEQIDEMKKELKEYKKQNESNN